MKQAPMFATSTACLLVLGALAPAARGEVRPMRYVIKDANGTVVGPATTTEFNSRVTTAVVIDGVVPFLPLVVEAPSSFLPQGTIYGGLEPLFTDSSCMTSPHLFDGPGFSGTPVSVRDGRVFVPTGDPATSVGINSVLRASGCDTSFSGTFTMLPAVEVDPLPFVPPFSLEPIPEAQMTYTTMAPCRLIDTRDVGAQTTGLPLTNPGPHDFRVQGHCGVPEGARAVSVNLTVIAPSEAGDARLTPADQPPGPEPTSVLNFPADVTLANASIVRLGVVADPGDSDLQLRIAMVQPGTAHFTVDVTGWFE